MPTQYVKFSFFKFAREWFQLTSERRALARKELTETIALWSRGEGRILRSYTLVGVRPDTDIMLWQIAPSVEDHHELAKAIRACDAGGYITEPYGYLAVTKRSIYIDAHSHPGEKGDRSRIVPGTSKYLFIYPFVKTREWYRLPMEDRQRAMDEHIKIGHKYPEIKINTTYSFGLDDQEFVVAFEGDDPAEFVDLVMELRGSEASAYTERDVPIFTCIAAPLAEAIEAT